jgi:hypothetical protein
MATHELSASDLSWPRFSFSSRREASLFADRLEARLASPEPLSPEVRAEAEAMLEELLALLFSPLR